MRCKCTQDTLTIALHVTPGIDLKKSVFRTPREETLSSNDLGLFRNSDFVHQKIFPDFFRSGNNSHPFVETLTFEKSRQ